MIEIITPPAGKYDMDAEAVKDILAQAAKHGADAIFVESLSQSESTGWKASRGFGGISAGSFKEREYRAKAIFWK